MKSLNALISKIGQDKFDHHILGALVCALISIVFILQDGVFGWIAVGYPLTSSAIIFFISVVKEYALDDKPDWGDIISAMPGCLWKLSETTKIIEGTAIVPSRLLRNPNSL